MMKLYNWCLKVLLGVRKSTCNDVCCVESGYPPLQDLVCYRQHKFVHASWRERIHQHDDPLHFVLNLVKHSATSTGRTVTNYVTNDVIPWRVVMSDVVNGVRNSVTSKRVTYKSINPNLSVHHVYQQRHIINEIHRLSFTKFRVSGHSLACETGRWNKRDRGCLALEDRLCRCGDVQDEQHVTQHCPLTQGIRDNHHFTTMEQLFSDQFSPGIVCKILHDILMVFK